MTFNSEIFLREKMELEPVDIYGDLKGAIDLHIHTTPDGFPRLLDDLEVARQARDVGMRAVLLKCHVTTTCDRAYLVRRVIKGIEVFGGIVLNHPVGGLNPYAVATAIYMGAKAIWMPTMWADQHVRYSRQRNMDGYQAIGMSFPEKGVTVLSDSGELLPEAQQILKMIADHDLMLGMSHLSYKEQKVMIPAAKMAGVTKIVVNHPTYQVLQFSLDQIKELADMGAYMEFCLLPLTPQWTLRDPEKGWSPKRVAQAIKDIGPERCLLATDGGQIHNPTPIEGLRTFIRMMREEGLSSEEIALMTKTNPAKMLGLS
jgi:hypothetical protein